MGFKGYVYKSHLFASTRIRTVKGTPLLHSWYSCNMVGVGKQMTSSIIWNK